MKRLIQYWLLTFSVLFLSISPSESQIKPNIVGGQNGNITQVPWQVLIELNNAFECGGVILAPQWILTCGHCVFNTTTNSAYQPNLFTVYAGVTDTINKAAGQLGIPDEIILNPNYSYPVTNDIALIHLNAPLIYNANVNQITPATENDANAGYLNPGVVAQVSGWGVDASGYPSNMLQILNETIVANNTINQTLYKYPITNNNLAAGGTNGQGSCNGDSGGPLTVLGNNNVRILAGLVDFGPSAGCASGNPDIYVRIPSYIDFIAVNTSTLSGTQPCCSNFSTTYTLNSVFPLTNVTWTTSTDFSPTAGTGVSATISSANSSSNTGTITFTFTALGSAHTATYNISNGQAIYANLTNDGNNELGTVNSVPVGQTTVFVTAASTPSYTWSLTGSGISWAPNGNGSSMTFVLNSGQSGTWSVTANNRCASYRDITFTTQQFYGYGFDIIQTNGGALVVKARPPKGTSASATYSFNVALYSPNAKKIAELLNNNNVASFNTGNLAKGKYTIVISRNTASVSVPVTLK